MKKPLIALILFMSGSAFATNYYCDPVRGLPTNTGSKSSPWRTLAEVFSQGKTFINGDTLYLLSGNHGTPVVKGGIASGNRTITALNGQTPTVNRIIFKSGATRWAVSNILVSPYEADGKSSNRQLLQIDEGAENNIISQCKIRYAPDSIAEKWDNDDWVKNSGTAVYVVGKNNQLINNQIRNTRHGIILERKTTAGAGATGTLISHNTIDHFWEDAFRCQISNCTFEYNLATNSYQVIPSGKEEDPPHRDMFQSYRGDGSFTPIENVVLRGNVFISRKGIRYNKVPFQVGTNHTIQGIGCFDGPYDNWTVENNIVMVEASLALTFRGIYNSTIVNNTVVPNPNGSNSEIRILEQKDGSASDNNIVRNNLARGFNLTSTRLNQSNNIIIDDYSMYFVNYDLCNVRLHSGSPAINAGTTTDAPTIDADKNNRTTPFDVGAFEYQETTHLKTEEIIPYQDELKNNYPNPFNPSTIIEFELAASGFVNLSIYTLLGKKILTLIAENKTAGKHEVIFTPNNLPSGIYYSILRSGGFTSTKKLTYIK